MLRGTFTAGVFTAALIASVGVPAQQCQPDEPESVDQRLRRESAVRFVQQVNSAQARAHAERGRYAPLAETSSLADVPVGFVPRLTADQWGYVISLKDLFDPCGFSLFSDQDGTIYEARVRPPPR
jgi:hypothetical protein